MATIIVAYAKNRVIGKDNKIPWKIPEDMKLFKNITTDNIVAMGRNTWNSLPKKPLKNRINIVISKNWCVNPWDIYFEGYCVPSLEAAYDVANRFNDKELFIIGGASVYKEALDKKLVNKIIASELRKDYDGDTYFPTLSEEWKGNLIAHYKDFDLMEYNFSE